MKDKIKQSLHIFEGGKANWEKTDEYDRKARDIERQVREKYAPIIAAKEERLGRFVVRVRMRLEIWKKINRLSSNKNLHLNPLYQI